MEPHIRSTHRTPEPWTLTLGAHAGGPAWSLSCRVELSLPEGDRGPVYSGGSSQSPVFPGEHKRHHTVFQREGSGDY